MTRNTQEEVIGSIYTDPETGLDVVVQVISRYLLSITAGGEISRTLIEKRRETAAGQHAVTVECGDADFPEVITVAGRIGKVIHLVLVRD